ncbi:MAG: dTDP-4-dehydrorhamnose reductase [Rhodospirillales bacterium]|nr:dTDP-4-dehydrorhamnose reductase [Rhodospirillales bacterium]
MTSLRLLIFGKTGQVARALAERSDISARFLDREQADLSRPETLESLIENADCDVVVNAAAYTAVDKAESEPELARAINALAPGAMARACAAKNIPFIHISTDYVFDGTKNGPYLETDPVHPLGIYGATKEEGERAVMAAGGRAVILRTSWVFSPWGNNFVKTMLRLGAEREELKIVADQTGAPTSAIDIADGIVTVARKLAAGQGTSGIYHMSAGGETTWHGFARAIFAHALQHGLKTPARVLPIPSSNYPTPAKRPMNSRLDCSKIAREFGVSLPGWEDGLARALGQLLDTEGKKS